MFHLFSYYNALWCFLLAVRCFVLFWFKHNYFSVIFFLERYAINNIYFLHKKDKMIPPPDYVRFNHLWLGFNIVWIIWPFVFIYYCDLYPFSKVTLHTDCCLALSQYQLSYKVFLHLLKKHLKRQVNWIVLHSIIDEDVKFKGTIMFIIIVRIKQFKV